MLQDFKSVSDHFTTFQSKGLNIHFEGNIRVHEYSNPLFLVSYSSFRGHKCHAKKYLLLFVRKKTEIGLFIRFTHITLFRATTWVFNMAALHMRT